MKGILTLTLRPRRLSEMIGQADIVKALRRQMTTRPASAFLLHGGTGTGKTTLARIIATSLQCSHQNESWGEPCEGCLAQAANFSISEVNASEINGVDDIGRIAATVKYLPLPPSLKRVIILDEAQMMSTNAQNLLLKYFEDTPPHVVWIICTTAPTKILTTLRRRCIVYQLKSLTYDGQREMLETAARKTALKKPVAPLIKAAEEEGVFSPALLLMGLEKYTSGMDARAAMAGTDSPVANSLAICKAVTSGQWLELRKLLGDVTPEQSRWLRSSVAGWLRGCLLRESSPKRRIALANALFSITGPAPLEDGLMLPWLCGILFNATLALGKA